MLTTRAYPKLYPNTTDAADPIMVNVNIVAVVTTAIATPATTRIASIISRLAAIINDIARYEFYRRDVRVRKFIARDRSPNRLYTSRTSYPIYRRDAQSAPGRFERIGVAVRFGTVDRGIRYVEFPYIRKRTNATKYPRYR